ncbi:MAG: hypothetical protein IKD58_02010, partial [Loktanella sp.]|nr:hypothetical protein [Loktanella sp.]
DTTVMEKNIAYPTDARLYEKARAKLVALAQEAGITLRQTIARKAPALAVVDRGYRGHGVEKTKVLISGTKRGLTPKIKKLLRRRSAIEPEIGHMKSDGRLARCPLKRLRGDAIFAVLCGCGHNIRKILRYLRSLFVYLLAAFITVMQLTTDKAAGNHASYSAAAA